jgi:hypothetical protein
MLEEFKDAADPAMMLIQQGVDWNINNHISLNIAGTYYDFMHIKGSDMTIHSHGTNSRNAKGQWLYDFNSIAIDAELGVKLPFFIEYASFTVTPGPSANSPGESRTRSR